MIKVVAVVLIVFGMSSIAWGGFSYKTKDKVVDIGTIEATREKTHRVPVAPLAGGLAMAVGIGLLVVRKA